MLNLSGILDTQTCRIIGEMVLTRFVDSSIFKTPESLILYEQRYLSNEVLLSLCNEQYDSTVTLTEPKRTFVPTNIINSFKNSRAVPIAYSPSTKTVSVLYIPEYPVTKPNINVNTVNYIPTTLHYYIINHMLMYGEFDELLPTTGKMALDMIIEEAIKLEVPDITISNEHNGVIVYYNKLKRKMLSNNVFPKYIMDEIIKVLTISTPIVNKTDNKAKYVGYDIDEDYRARVLINKNYYGHVISIRLYPQTLFNKTFEDLNINQQVIDLFRDTSINQLSGLRVIVGGTNSGKNTTALAALREVVDEGYSKVVSIEMPTEQRLDGVEQIGVEYMDEYVSNIESLIHQNPDYVYIAETKDETGLAVMRVANTDKKVITTLHSNSVADTISRIVDITGLSSNRIIQVLHSIIHQSLVRIGDKLYPSNTFVFFDNELKQLLYDKPFGEIIGIINSRVKGGLKDGLL